MKVVGIDLSGPRNVAGTCVVTFEERAGRLQYLTELETPTDERICGALSAFDARERVIVGIDAPLSYDQGRGERDSDKELRRQVRQKSAVVGVIAPMAPRMTFLTLHGIALTRMVETLRPQMRIEMVEVHPGGCMLLRGAPVRQVENFKKEPLARVELCAWLSTQGLDRLPSVEARTDHFVAACAAALGAWSWARGESVWCFPASPPEHPYDFAC